MAHLLGSRYCIESLHNDVSDLQVIIVDVFLRAGPVNSQSWKYPDKMARDVNVQDLLGLHIYSEDEEERQVAHIVLLELVIDRLVLLLQAMARYLEQTLSFSRTGSASVPSHNNTSIGLVVQKYWNKMIHLHTVSQQLHSEVKSKGRKVAELEEEVKNLMLVMESMRSGTGETEQGVGMMADALLPGGVDSKSLATLLSVRKRKPEISRDECNKACQTVETAFVACEECDRVQTNLRELGLEVSRILRSQDLTSALERHLGYIKDLEWLTHHDLSRWTAEQRKDLLTLRKHMTWLRDKVDPLEEGIKKEEERSRKQSERITQLNKDLALEKETQSIQLSNFEKKLQQTRGDKQVEIDRLKQELRQVMEDRTRIQQLEEMSQVHQQQLQNKLHNIELENCQLKDQLEKSQTDETRLRSLQSDVQHLKCQLDKGRGRLSEVTRELNKEKARNKSVNKHTESLQGKQDSLLERIDSLDVENDDLRCQLADLHEEKDRVDDALHAARSHATAASETTEKLEARIHQLEREKAVVAGRVAELEVRVRGREEELKEVKEQQQLLVEYPDLHGPVNREIHGSGDITVDMENQVKANEVRIRVLEDQNTSLRKTISKMLEMQQRMVEPSPAPLPLWKPPPAPPSVLEEEAEDLSDSDNAAVKLFHKRRPADKPVRAASGGVDWVPPETFTVKKAPSPRGQRKAGKQRPASAKPALTTAPSSQPSTSSISAYIQLKRSGMLKSAAPSGRSRPSSGVSKVPSEGPTGTRCCDKCDRTFHHKKDLEIHRNYCFGGL